MEGGPLAPPAPSSGPHLSLLLGTSPLLCPAHIGTVEPSLPRQDLPAPPASVRTESRHPSHPSTQPTQNTPATGLQAGRGHASDLPNTTTSSWTPVSSQTRHPCPSWRAERSGHPIRGQPEKPSLQIGATLENGGLSTQKGVSWAALMHCWWAVQEGRLFGAQISIRTESLRKGSH